MHNLMHPHDGSLNWMYKIVPTNYAAASCENRIMPASARIKGVIAKAVPLIRLAHGVVRKSGLIVDIVTHKPFHNRSTLGTSGTKRPILRTAA